MAELNDVLAAGTVPEVNASTSASVAGSPVITEATFSGALGGLTTGIPIPELADSSAAGLSTLFWDLSEGQLRYKTPGGIVLEVRTRST